MLSYTFFITKKKPCTPENGKKLRKLLRWNKEKFLVCMEKPANISPYSKK